MTATLRHLALVLLTLFLVAGGQGVSAAAQDPEAARREVQRKKAATAGEVDVLRASDSEIERTLADLQDNIRKQQRRAAAAREEAAAAATALQRAKEASAIAAQRLSDLREEMRVVAVEAYVAGPVQGLAIAVKARSFNELANRRFLLGVTTAKAAETADQLRSAGEDMRLQQGRAAAAADRAEAEQEQAEAGLRQLRAAEETQARVAKAVEARLEQTLAEVAALAAVDERLAAEIGARQARLAAQLAPRRPPAVVAPVASTPSKLTSPPTRSSTTVAPVTTPTKGGGAATTTVTSAPAQTRPSSPPALTTVRGITVATSVAGDLRSLLDAADAAGLNLSGGGYRSSDAQVVARRTNCGPTDYDIYEKPASECSPPTARPGQSMHEQGLAVDFTSDANLITSRSDRAYLWLSRNAARFGLYNLPREPWHWSTNGS